jgi:serine protease Do
MMVRQMAGSWHVFRQSAWLAAVAVSSLGFAIAWSGPAVAQRVDAVPASTAGSSAITNSAPAAVERSTEYDALARDVSALDRELGIVKRVVKLVTPAVVHIEARPRPRSEEVRQMEEAGSGVIIDIGNQQYVLTNRHVVGRSTPDRVNISLADGRIFRPLRIWSDDLTDVAVMSIDYTGLPSVRLGDSDALEIGEYVLAIGSPFGLSQSVTRGIISAKGRHNLNLGEDDPRKPEGRKLLQDFLQTDAAINPGNSGGPLVNLRGEVVGLNTAIASASGGNEGIGFSIPVNIASRVAHALVQGKRIPRGHLGVTLDSNYGEAQARALGLSHLMGTRVSDVRANSPAAGAELKVGDVILEFNGVRIEHDTHLINQVQITDVGRNVEIMVLRGGKPLRLVARIGDEPQTDAPQTAGPASRPSSGR